MFTRAPIRIGLTSPRTMQPNQILLCAPISVSPVTVAFGEIQASSAIVGRRASMSTKEITLTSSSRLSWFTHEISRGIVRKSVAAETIVAVIASRRLSLTKSGPPWGWAERQLCLRYLDQNARRPGRYDLQIDEYEAGPACRAQKWRTAPSANSDSRA